MIRLIEKSIILPSQANNKVAYFWGLNTWNVSLNSKPEAKCRLNIYTPLLSTKSTELFDCQFWKQGLDNNKAQN